MTDQFHKRSRGDGDPLHECARDAWREVLRADPAQQPDFALAGGSSMDALDLQLRIFQATGRKIDLDAIEEPLTFQGILEAMACVEPVSASGAIQRSESDEHPATAAQISQWTYETANPGSSAYAVPILFRFEEAVGIDRLARTVARLVEAHPALRTTVHPTQDMDAFVQVVRPAGGAFALETRAVVSLDADDLQPLIGELLRTPPSIVHPSPCRAIALQQDGAMRGLLLLCHHAALDEWSIRVLTEDLAGGLEGATMPPERLEVSALEPPPIREESLQWWGGRLAEKVSHVRFPEPARAAADDGARPIERALEEGQCRALDAVCMELGVEPAAAFVHAVGLALGRILPEAPSRLQIGVPMSLRNDPRLDRTVGMLLNTLPVEVRLDEIDTREGIISTREGMREARRHRFVPYEQLARAFGPRRTDGRAPWLDVMVGFVDRPIPARDGVSGSVLETTASPAPLLVVARRTPGGSLRYTIRHDVTFVDHQCAGDFADALEEELASIATGAWRISRDSLLGGEPSQAARTLLDIVDQVVEDHPDAVAIETDTESICHRELREMTTRLAGALVEEGVEPGDVVAIDCPPGAAFPVGVLGALRAGAVVMPLAPELPEQRRRALLEASGAKRILDTAAIHVGCNRTARTVPVEVDVDSGCYLLFTSGSTGEPKGVVMSHGPIANLVDVERRESTHAARTAMLAPLGFDVVFQEIFSTWACGGTLVPVDGDVRRDPVQLAGFLAEKGITRIHVSPVLLGGLARASGFGGTPLPALGEVISAGEELVVSEALREMARASGGFQLRNQYGPTETHVATSIDLGEDPEDWPQRPSIGAPIDGVRIRIVDADGRVVARGFEGELQIGGRGPAKGYLGRDDEDRFFTDADGRWYRTGDHAAIDGSGMIRFMGRRDHQVKIAGHRVEPGEIESILHAMPGIDECAVVPVPAHGSDVLWAFVAGGDARTIDVGMINDALARSLPDWMRPRGIEVMASLPTNANGKIDRGALRERLQGTAPGRAAEEGADDLGALIEGIIGLNALPRTRKLAELGLDSLGAIRLQFDLQGCHGVVVPVRDLLAATIDDVEEMLRQTDPPPASPEVHVAPPPAPKVEHVRPLDPLERDLLAEVAAAPQGAFHLAWTVDFDFVADPTWLQQSIHAMRVRYPSLRTARSVSTGARLIDIDSLPPPRLEQLDHTPEEDVLGGLLRHPLDLENGECMRAASWNDGERSTVLLVVHHAAIDGRGAEGVIAEFVGNVESCARGVEPSLDAHDLDAYTFNERPEDVAWWVNGIRSRLGEHLPEVTRRHDRDGETMCVRIERASTFREAAQRHAREHGLPPTAPLLAAWAVMVSQLVGRDRVLIGVPFAVQPTNGASIRLGASILPVAVDVSPERTLQELIDDVAECLSEGLDHRYASFGSIARSFAGQGMFGRTPFDAVLTVDAGDRLLGGSRIAWKPTGVSPFQAALVFNEADSGGFVAQLEHGLLHGEAIDSFAQRYAAQLETWLDVLRHGSERTVGDLPQMSSAQARVLDAFESGGPSTATEKNVISMFRSVVDEQPDAPAIIDQHGRTSYRELDVISGVIARRLRSAGVVAGDRVAFMGIRSGGSIAAMLGIARSGGVYVPIDPHAPLQRVVEQFRSAGVAFVLGEGLPAPFQEMQRVVPMPGRDALDADLEEVAGPEPDAASGLYVMFTSGTTGESKGSLISHGAVMRLVSDQPFLCVDGPLCMINAAPLAFDASTLEIWAPLLRGGTVSCWEGRGADLVGIGAQIVRDEVNAAWLTSALFQAAVDGVPDLFDTLQVILTGGDVVSAEHVRRIQERCPGLVVVNGYGPTENTVFTACEVIAPGALAGCDAVSIGRPIRGTTVRIVDAHGRRVAPGRIGELVAGGDGVALGYVAGDPEGRFQIDGAGRAYRTGDLARWAPDGRLEFHGRGDGQVKIGGHRIEFAAIESALRTCPGVTDACVATIGRGARRKLIAAIAGGESSISIATVRKWLENRLAPPEIPSTIVAVPVMPVTANGKADRRAVAELVQAAPEVTAEVTGDEELIGIVIDVINDTIDTTITSPSQRLVDAGADSLDMVRITLALGDRLARPVDLGEVLQGGTPGGIAARLRSNISRESGALVVLRGSRDSEKPAAYCIPGVGGTVFSYESLLDAIDPEIPVFGLPYPGLSGGEEPLDTVEALADRFAETIVADRTAQVIVGYSLGGFVAFETARRVQELTGLTPMVVAIDSAPSALPAWRGLRGKLAIRKAFRLRLEAVLPPGVVGLLRGRRQVATLASLRNVVAAGFRAVRSYNPKSAPVDVLLLRTTRTNFGGVEGIEDLGWSHIATRTRTRSIEGRHLEVFRGSTGMDVGMAITDAYNRSGRLILQRRQSFRSSGG